MSFRPIACALRLFAVVLACLGGSNLHATPDLRFDVVWFCCPCYPTNHLCQTQFDALNLPTPNGHYLAMSTDEHRAYLYTNGNVLAALYNTLNDNWTNYTAAQTASNIDQYVTANCTSTGPKPTWLAVNEISSGGWQNDPDYRAWVCAVTGALHTNFNYTVILYAPFANPGNNGTNWQDIGRNAYVGIENYLSGEEIKAQSYSVSWCQSQYQSSITSYTNRGVPRAKLMLGEHFGQTVSGTGWGRAGVATNEWIQAINARSVAARNIGFTGYLTYAWYSDTMLAPDSDLLQFETTYATNSLPTSNPLTPPYAILQPESQTAAEGSTVTFSVTRAGIAPMTFQWQFNGTKISGATNSSLILTNIQPADAGNYFLLMSNSAGVTISSNALLTVQIPPPLAAEPFAPAKSTYAIGANLIGQTNVAGQGWTQAGPASATQPVIASSNLVANGLAASLGNSIKFGGNGTSARFNFGTNFTSGTVYFSFLAKVTDLTGQNSTGIFWAGFNNSTGTQTTTPTAVGTRVLTRTATGGYNLGLDKTSGTVSNLVFAPAVFTTNDTLFIVGSYTFNSATTSDDVSQLWINPDSSTFGSGLAPAPTLTNTNGGDMSPQIASFVFFDRSGSEPAGILADELRIGLTWASVTPVVDIVPSLSASLSAGKVIISWSTNAVGFQLEQTPMLGNGATWSAANLPVFVNGSRYFVTNSASDVGDFFRLRKP